MRWIKSTIAFIKFKMKKKKIVETNESKEKEYAKKMEKAYNELRNNYYPPL